MKNLQITYLLDFYGKLLSDKQRDIMELYYMEDLSLAEIAEHKDITRQGVRDNIVRAEKELINFEQSLKLCEKFRSVTASLDKIKNILKPETIISIGDYNKITDIINNVEDMI